MEKVGFYTAIITFFLGVAIHTLVFPLPSSFLFPFFLILLSLPLIALPVRWKFLPLVLSVAFSLGFLRFDISLRKHEAVRNEFIPLLQSDKSYQFTGEVSERPKTASYGRKAITLHVESVLPQYGKSDKVFHPSYDTHIRFLIRDTMDQYHYGQMLSVTGKLRPIEDFQTENGRIFDYRHYLEKENTFYQLSPVERVEIVGKGKATLTTKLYGIKDYFLKKIQFLLPQPESSLLAGILLGEKTALPNSLENAFRRTGLMHIVVLSGYNVSIVIMAMIFLLAWLPLRWRLIVAGFGILAFTILVGAGPTVVRAALMASFLILSRMIGKVMIAERILLLVAFLMVIVNPWILIYDISFQLSFLATYGLMELMPFFENILSFVPNLFEFRKSLSATLSAQVFVMPLIVYAMGNFSLVSPFVNMLVLFMVPIAMLLGFLLVISSSLLPFLTPILIFLSTYSLRYIIRVAQFFSSLRIANIEFAPFSPWWLVVMYGLVALFVWGKRKRYDEKLTIEEHFSSH